MEQHTTDFYFSFDDAIGKERTVLGYWRSYEKDHLLTPVEGSLRVFQQAVTIV